MKRPSPNFNERKKESPLRFFVIHITNMESAEAALDRLTDPASAVSAHDVIDEDGTLYELVAPEKRAWHAGAGFWRGERDMNSASIGIELVNPGPAFGYRPFPRAQIETLKKRLRTQAERFGIPLENLLGHSDYAPTRRPDPGHLFPWKELAAEGLGLWGEERPEDSAPATPDEIRLLLQKIGYDPSLLEEASEPSLVKEVLLAFQKHFVQTQLTGEDTPDTCARLRAVERSFSKRPFKAPSGKES